MANKLLGQHFLRCQWVANTLIETAELKKSDTVLEVGSGTGVLTRELSKKAGRVISVEKDKGLAAELRLNLAREKINNVEVVDGDILKLLTNNQLPAISGYKIVANIPYYLTSRLLRLLLEGASKPKIIVMTIQKEVAERMTAKPGQMNILATSVQVFAKPEIIKQVPRNCFSPQPKVDSAVISISLISDDFFTKNGLDKEFFFAIVRQGFSQKRKILANTLKKFRVKDLPFSLSRPQELSLENWVKVIRIVQEAEPL